MTPEPVVPEEPASAQRRAANPCASIWVAASAGTGKTKVLTDRVLNLLLAGTPPERLLCLTFTRAAAAEMASRIHKSLGGWATAPDAEVDQELAQLVGHPPDAAARDRARCLFAQVLDAPGGLKIQTIHAFCQSLLRRFPLEAEVPPHFQLADERTAAELLAEAQAHVLGDARHGSDPQLATALSTVNQLVGEGSFTELLAELVKERARFARLLEGRGGLDGVIAALRRRHGLDPHDTEESLIATACGSPGDESGLRAAAEAMREGGSKDRVAAELILQWLSEPELRAARFDDYVSVFLTQDGRIRRKLIHAEALKRAPAADSVLAAEAERLLRVRGRCKSAAVVGATGALLRIGHGVLEDYERQKALRGLLDYDDLILATLRLLTQDGVAPWVLFKLDGGIDHILIDEAQDTNPEQWQVVAALAEEFYAGEGARPGPRTVFAVGDGKQSIFSFQRADPAAFERMRGFFADRVRAAQAHWDEVDLEVSFRSTEAVLNAVDAVFAAEAVRQGVVFSDHPVTHRAHRVGHAGLVELWPTVAPQAVDPPPAWTPPVERRPGDSPRARLACILARRIRAWLDDGEFLECRGRPLRPGDIMVLVRRRSGFVDELVRALKDHRVPVAGVDRMVLTDQLAVMDLIALGRFLLLPEDDLTLATVLKGPLVGLDEDQLFALCHGRDGRLWSELGRRVQEDAAFARAHSLLAGLLARADYVPPFELFAAVLGAGGGRHALLARLGPEAQDPIDEFLTLAQLYERSHVPSLEGFLHWVAATQTEIKRDLEQGGRDEVRVMTVHGAKGLQAPVVILPDTLQTPRQCPPVLWLEDGEGVVWAPRRSLEDEHCAEARLRAEMRRDEEHRRLLYVAMTRAEDRLYVCGWENKTRPGDGCWYYLIRDGLAALAEPVAFDFAALGPEGWAGPGLRLSRPQTADPKSDDRAAPAALGSAPLPEWARRAAPGEPSPARPLAPSRPAAAEPAVLSPLSDGGPDRFRRGLVVHRLLQTLPDLPTDRRAAACRRFLNRPGLGLAAAAQEALAREVLAVLDHPDFAPLFQPGSRAEVPLAGTVPGPHGEEVVFGQVDRLLVTEEAVLVVDYKTNRPPPLDAAEVPEVYLRQMAAYRALLRRIYDTRPVRCALLWTDGPRLLPLDERLLLRYRPD